MNWKNRVLSLVLTVAMLITSIQTITLVYAADEDGQVGISNEVLDSGSEQSDGLPDGCEEPEGSEDSEEVEGKIEDSDGAEDDSSDIDNSEEPATSTDASLGQSGESGIMPLGMGIQSVTEVHVASWNDLVGEFVSQGDNTLIEIPADTIVYIDGGLIVPSGSFTIAGDGILKRGTRTGRLISVSAGRGLVLDGITIDGESNEFSTASQAAIYSANATLRMVNGASIINNKSSELGGAVIAEYGELYIEDGCVFEGIRSSWFTVQIMKSQQLLMMLMWLLILT